MVVSPKPTNVLVGLLRSAARAELAAQGVLDATEVSEGTREHLEKVMLSRIFDLDGLQEVLADLDKSRTNQSPANPVPNASCSEQDHKPNSRALSEIQDSQDDEPGQKQEQERQIVSPQKAESLPFATPLQRPADNSSCRRVEVGNVDAELGPQVILITHVSSLLTSLFTHREKSAAHATLRVLGSHLRHLSRNLPSSPLIILLNSTDSSARFSSESYAYPSLKESRAQWPSIPQYCTASPPTTLSTPGGKAIDASLKSIFNSPSLPIAVSHPYQGTINVPGQDYKTNKPSFGLVFSQLLDLHLLCTRVPKTCHDLHTLHRSAGVTFISARPAITSVTVIEVLLDEMGVWEGKRGTRKRREQRWAALDIFDGRVADAFVRI